MVFTLLEIDPDSVRAGWMPLIIVVGLGICVSLLYLSMRHELRKITTPRRDELASEPASADEAATTRS